MEGLGPVTPDFWSGRKVFITGHTGFKGSWLSLYLLARGAKLFGYSLPPVSPRSLYQIAGVGAEMPDVFGDIRDTAALRQAIENFEPDVILHLAAQALVLPAYKDPFETFAVNVMGVVSLLEAIRTIGRPVQVINVTTDKVYENQEWVWGYRETDALGGKEPYGVSKAAAEMVTTAYRQSYFQHMGIGIATVRAGNVIGGGDFSEFRLIPDILRAAESREKLEIRSPNATRPWQHVLEPVRGYVELAEAMLTNPGQFEEAFNFGPAGSDVKPVWWVQAALNRRLGVEADTRDIISNSYSPESQNLALDTAKVKSRLGWTPRLDIEAALGLVADWHRAHMSGQDMNSFTKRQIVDYGA